MPKGNIHTSESKKRYYDTYKKEHLKEKHKIVKLQAYLKDNPNDLQVVDRIKQLQATI